MPNREIIQGLHQIQDEVKVLREEIRSLKEDKAQKYSELRGMLRRRGLDLYRENPIDHLLFPAHFTEKAKEQFYVLFKRYSFRLFLREILNRQGIFRVAEVVRFSSTDTGYKYLHSLIDLGLVESAASRGYRLRYLPSASLGPTLEWFMSEVLRREFFCAALYGMRFKGTPSGGDYDVIADLEGRLVYMEVKSSPPKNIEGDEVHEFLGRLQDLIPNLALFFVDTELRLKDKIIPMFEAERFALPEPESGALLPIQKIADEIYFVPSRIYVLGSKRSIVQNLALCFRHHFIHSSIHSPDNGISGQRSN